MKVQWKKVTSALPFVTDKGATAMSASSSMRSLKKDGECEAANNDDDGDISYLPMKLA